MPKKEGGGMSVAEAGERIGRRGGQKVADLIERAKSLGSEEQAGR